MFGYNPYYEIFTLNTDLEIYSISITIDSRGKNNP